MKFTDIFRLYIDGHPLPADIEALLPMQCIHTQEDVLIDAYNHRHENTYYHHLFLDSLGDITTDTPLVVFGVYQTIYAGEFERDLRQKRTNNSVSNKALCARFNIPNRYLGVTFDTLPERAEQKQLVNTAKNWCKRFDESLLLGSKMTGVGKTTTAVCSLMEYYIQHDTQKIGRYTGRWDILNSNILMLRERDLYSTIRRTYANDIPLYEHQIIDRLCEIDFLVYDDMFSVNDGDFMKRVLFSIFDQRIESDGKPTLITTRYPLEMLKKNFPDIYSRLERGKLYYHNSTKDLRKEK